jgi:acyl dehydratase
VDLRQRWFDDYSVGEVFEIGSHPMTEERIVSFGREFDPQLFHVDPEAAAGTIYGGLIASGWHTGSVMMKLLATTVLGPSSLGSPGCDTLRWKRPVRPGDVLTLRLPVLDVRPSTSKPDRGVVRCRCELVNQDGETAMSLDSMLLLSRDPALAPGREGRLAGGK